ncbi:MAG: hypothetical protein ACLPKW_25520, partial [Acetobacteraceae bacterium]
CSDRTKSQSSRGSFHWRFTGRPNHIAISNKFNSAARIIAQAATETAVAACAMIRAAELNLFDIAMWFGRPVNRL